MKEDIVIPAYAQKKNDENNSNKKNIKENKKNIKFNKNKIKKMFIIILITISAVALIFGIIFLIRVIKYSKYDEYSKQMDNYALSSLFDNGKSTSFEKVTKSEAIKIIIASIQNTGDISKVFSNEEEYKNQFWVDYAISKGIITAEQVNKDNAQNKITYIEYITYFANARIKLLNATLDTSIYPNFSDITTIKSEELYALSDLIVNDVIENSSDKVNPSKSLYKGELNKLTVEIIKKYNLIIPSEKKFNISQEKTPSNSDKYPYILFDVAKETYEKPFLVKNEEKFKTPVQVFSKERAGIEQIMENTELYFNTILNIDYENIDAKNLREKLEGCLLFPIDDGVLEEYVEYVKSNKIKLKGTGVAQLPILYYDGEVHRLRTKIEFEILNSDTKENILYYDLESGNTITYEQNKYSFFIDATVDTPTSNAILMYVWENDIYSQKTDEKIENITVIEKEELEEEVPLIV